MFRFISTKRYKELLELEQKIGELEASLDATRGELASCSMLTESLIQTIDELRKEKEAETQNLVFEDSNYVKILFSNDLQQISPFIGFRADCFESLFQEGMLKDGQENNSHAIQLALLSLANDGLSQLLEAFEADVVSE
jgi:hypothetical protein